MSRTLPSRRGFFGLSAAATAVAAAPAVALPETAVPFRVEALHGDGELLAFGPRLDEASRRFLAAQARLEQAYAEFERRRPPVPAAMLRTRLDQAWRLVTEEPRDIAGKHFPYTGGEIVHLVPSWSVRDFLEGEDRRTRLARQLRGRLPAIEAYEKAIEDLRRELDADGTLDALDQARQDLDVLARGIMALPATTMAGLVIKARTIVVHAQTEAAGHSWVAFLYGKRLAAEVIAVLGP